MNTIRGPRCCPQCSARLLPEETVCNKCSNNTSLPPRRNCPWCREFIPRGTIICRHCHADLAVPAPEPTFCATCGAAMRSNALACVRCGTRVQPDVGRGEEPTEELALTLAGSEQTDAPGRVRESLVGPRDDVPTASSRAVRDVQPWRTRGFAIVFLGILAAEAAGACSSVLAGLMPWPHGPLDKRVAAWIVLHAVAVAGSTAAAAFAACVLPRRQRTAVWSVGSLALTTAAPFLAIPWTAAMLAHGAWSVLFGRDVDPSNSGAARRPVDPLLSPPRVRPAWRIALLAGAVVAAWLVSAAEIWPQPWRGELPVEVRGVVDAAAMASSWLRWAFAVAGAICLLGAAFGWYWETLDEGGLVNWLSPVVLLWPLLVFLSTWVLTGLGRDAGGETPIDVLTAARESALFWGLVSLYGVYYLVTSWAAMQRHVATAVVAYALCSPVFLTGWEAARIDAHRIQCGRNLGMLAAAVRQYAAVYRELPPPATRGAEHQPLLSWRVLVLPFLGEQALYERFHLDEPWDSAHNRALARARPGVFRCDELEWDDAESTVYFAPVGEHTCFPPGGGVPASELKAHGADVILLLERDSALRIPWTAPGDPELDRAAIAALSSNHGPTPLTVTASGAVDDLRPSRKSAASDAELLSRFRRPSAFNE